jgi:hypothetical protein
MDKMDGVKNLVNNTIQAFQNLAGSGSRQTQENVPDPQETVVHSNKQEERLLSAKDMYSLTSTSQPGGASPEASVNQGKDYADAFKGPQKTPYQAIHRASDIAFNETAAEAEKFQRIDAPAGFKGAKKDEKDVIRSLNNYAVNDATAEADKFQRIDAPAGFKGAKKDEKDVIRSLNNYAVNDATAEAESFERSETQKAGGEGKDVQKPVLYRTTGPNKGSTYENGPILMDVRDKQTIGSNLDTGKPQAEKKIKRPDKSPATSVLPDEKAVEYNKLSDHLINSNRNHYENESQLGTLFNNLPDEDKASIKEMFNNNYQLAQPSEEPFNPMTETAKNIADSEKFQKNNPELVDAAGKYADSMQQREQAIGGMDSFVKENEESIVSSLQTREIEFAKANSRFEEVYNGMSDGEKELANTLRQESENDDDVFLNKLSRTHGFSSEIKGASEELAQKREQYFNTHDAANEIALGSENPAFESAALKDSSNADNKENWFINSLIKTPDTQSAMNASETPEMDVIPFKRDLSPVESAFSPEQFKEFKGINENLENSRINHNTNDEALGKAVMDLSPEKRMEVLDIYSQANEPTQQDIKTAQMEGRTYYPNVAAAQRIAQDDNFKDHPELQQAAGNFAESMIQVDGYEQQLGSFYENNLDPQTLQNIDTLFSNDILEAGEKVGNEIQKLSPEEKEIGGALLEQSFELSGQTGADKNLIFLESLMTHPELSKNDDLVDSAENAYNKNKTYDDFPNIYNSLKSDGTMINPDNCFTNLMELSTPNSMTNNPDKMLEPLFDTTGAANIQPDQASQFQRTFDPASQEAMSPLSNDAMNLQQLNQLQQLQQQEAMSPLSDGSRQLEQFNQLQQQQQAAMSPVTNDAAMPANLSVQPDNPQAAFEPKKFDQVMKNVVGPQEYENYSQLSTNVTMGSVNFNDANAKLGDTLYGLSDVEKAKVNVIFHNEMKNAADASAQGIPYEADTMIAKGIVEDGQLQGNKNLMNSIGNYMAAKNQYVGAKENMNNYLQQHRPNMVASKQAAQMEKCSAQQNLTNVTDKMGFFEKRSLKSADKQAAATAKETNQPYELCQAEAYMKNPKLMQNPGFSQAASNYYLATKNDAELGSIMEQGADSPLYSRNFTTSGNSINPDHTFMNAMGNLSQGNDPSKTWQTQVQTNPLLTSLQMMGMGGLSMPMMMNEGGDPLMQMAQEVQPGSASPGAMSTVPQQPNQFQNMMEGVNGFSGGFQGTNVPQPASLNENQEISDIIAQQYDSQTAGEGNQENESSSLKDKAKKFLNNNFGSFNSNV